MEDADYDIEGELNRIRERRPRPDDESEAVSRFENWRRRDPYPNVDTGLLSAARFCDYVVETGMIHPFDVSRKDIKQAKYAFRIRGKVVRWSDDGGKESFTVGKGEKYDKDNFNLHQNSIAFVTLKPYLRIPDYVALRFNLKINNVYRGLLLGTGPIVDPGYQGNLSIPLHNLTTNKYNFRADERLVWVEFTKMSRPPKIEGVDSGKEKSSLYIPFPDPEEEEERDVEYHIREAESHRGIRSSIPSAIYAAEQAAEDAREEASEVSTQSNRSYYLTLAVIVFGLVSLVGVVGSYFFSVYGLGQKISKQEAQIESLQEMHREYDGMSADKDTTNN